LGIAGASAAKTDIVASRPVTRAMVIACNFIMADWLIVLK
jgi:hypothetical protein